MRSRNPHACTKWTAAVLVWGLALALLTPHAFGITGDLDTDGDVDREDLDILLLDRDRSVAESSCGSPCDLDGDGRISGLDARKLVLLCTRVRCNREPVADAGGPYSGKAGQPVQFDGSGSSDPDGDATSLAWDYGDGNVGAGLTPSHSYGTAETYTVTVTADDGRGGVQTGTTSVAIALDIAVDPLAPVTQAVGPAGSILGTIASGNRFILSLPQDAVLEPQDISVTPLNSVGGLPASFNLLAAVQLGPDGLGLRRPATVEIDLLSAELTEDLIAFGYRGDGEAFHAVPMTRVEETTVTFTLTHFSAVGVATAPESADENLSNAGLTAGEAAEQNIAGSLRNAGNPDREPGGLPSEVFNEIAAELQALYDLTVRPNLAAAVAFISPGPQTIPHYVNASSKLGNAIKGFIHWASEVKLLAGTGLMPDSQNPTEFDDEVANGLALAEQGITKIIALAESICANSSDQCNNQFLLDEILDWQGEARLLLGTALVEDPCPICMALETTFRVDPDAATVNDGDTVQLTASLSDCNDLPLDLSNRQLKWTSSNDLVASVPPSGTGPSIANVTAIALGISTVTVTVQDEACPDGTETGQGEKKAAARIDVVPDISGTWAVSGSEVVTGCQNPFDNGPDTGEAILEIQIQDGGTFTVVDAEAPADIEIRDNATGEECVLPATDPDCTVIITFISDLQMSGTLIPPVIDEEGNTVVPPKAEAQAVTVETQIACAPGTVECDVAVANLACPVGADNCVTSQTTSKGQFMGVQTGADTLTVDFTGRDVAGDTCTSTGSATWTRLAASGAMTVPVANNQSLVEVPDQALGEELSAQGAIEGLRAVIQETLGDERRSKRHGKKLFNKLTRALKKLEQGKPHKAMKALERFIDKVQKLIENERVNERAGRAWITQAEAIIEALGHY